MCRPFLKTLQKLKKSLDRVAGGNADPAEARRLCGYAVQLLRGDEAVRAAVSRLHEQSAHGFDPPPRDAFRAVENRILRPMNMSLRQLDELLDVTGVPPHINEHAADWLATQLHDSVERFFEELETARSRSQSRTEKKAAKNAILSGSFKVIGGAGAIVADAVYWHAAAPQSYVTGTIAVATGLGEIIKG